MRLRRRPKAHDLLRREFFLATEDHGLGTGAGLLDEDLGVGVLSLEDSADRSVMPIFTSEAQLLEWLPHGSAWIALRCPDVLSLFLHGTWDVIVIDPAGPDAFELSRLDAERMLGHAN